MGKIAAGISGLNPGRHQSETTTSGVARAAKLIRGKSDAS